MEAVISGWTKIPVEKLAAKESDRLKNLENIENTPIEFLKSDVE